MRSISSWRPRTASLVFLAVLLTACGGGGDGSDGGTPASAFPLSLTANNQKASIRVTSIYAESVLALGFDITNWVRSFTLAAESSISSACSVGGTRTWVWADKNRNAMVDSGDELTLTLADCSAPASGVRLSGSVSLTLSPAPAPGDLAASVSLGASGLTFTSGNVTGTWKGRLRVERSAAEVQDRLTVDAAAADGLRIELRADNMVATDRFESVSLSRVSDNDFQGVITTMSLTVASDVLQGRVSMATTIPLFAYFDTYPIEGDLEVFANGRVLLRADPNGSQQASFFVKVGDTSDSGTRMYWSDVMAGLAWVGPAGPLPERYTWVRETSTVPFAFIVGPPSTLEPTERTLNVQLNRQPALSGAVIARLQRIGDGWGPQSIDAMVQIRGTRLQLTWDHQLEPGSGYRVALFNAATLQPVTLQDRWDAEASLLSIPDLLVSNSLSAFIETNDRPYLLPSRPLRLRAAVVQPAGAMTVQYRWRQTAGASEVRLSATDQPVIDLSIDSAPGVDPYDVSIELEVIAASGVIDRHTIVLPVIPSPATSWMIQMDGSPGDPYLIGSRQFFASPAYSTPAFSIVRWAEGSPTPYLRVLARFSSGVVQSATHFIALPLGISLQPGTYQAPVSMAYRVNTAAMHLSTDFNSTFCQPLDAAFTIHEVQLSAQVGGVDGIPVERLALDYVYSCAGAPPVRGAMRLRSSVPLPP